MSQGRESLGNRKSGGRSTGGRVAQKGRGRGERGRGGRGRGRGRFHNKNNRSGRNQESGNRQNAPNTSRSYTIGPRETNVSVDAHENSTTQKNVTSQEEVPIGAYQYCSREECEERQELKQVHELEATLDTCTLPQAKRILDPCLAVSKFKRSAAGTSHDVKPAVVLERTLAHLQGVCATRKSTPQHPFVDNLQSWAEFLVDRLRAIQSDATRLSSTNLGVSREWHVQLVRILILVRYWTYSLDDPSWLLRTINTIVGTAMESYWGQGETLEGLSDAEERHHERLDDEMLCWSALLQVSQQQGSQTGAPMNQTDGSSYNGILSDFAKLSTSRKVSQHPMWRQVWTLAAHLVRHEYFAAWKKIDNITANASSESMSILFKCCIEPNLFLWRYRTIQQYNTSFAKEEHVTGVPRLLSINPEEWNVDRAGEFGLPVEPRDDGEIALVFKKVALEDGPPRSKVRDHSFAFGALYDANEKMCIASIHVNQVLKYGLS